MKGKTCPYCGAPAKITSLSDVCEFCGYVLEPNEKNQDKLSKYRKKKSTSVNPSEQLLKLQDLSFKSINSKYNYESNLKLGLLTVCTCGLYFLYKLVNWTDILNEADVSNMDKTDKGAVIAFSIITCGLAGIFYQYKIAKHSIDFTIRTHRYNDTVRKGIKKPIKNLPTTIVVGWIFSFAVSSFSEGQASIIGWAFMIWSIIAVQRSIEYAVGIRKTT